MATISELITRVETRLSLSAGIDVQIHAEDRLVEMVRHKYNVLFDDYWSPSYTYSLTGTLNGSGVITEGISNEVDRFIDIYAIYYGSDTVPLPLVGMNTNPTLITTRSVGASNEPEKVFKIYPTATTGLVHVLYRKRIKPAVWDTQAYDTVIGIDDELLFLGVMYEFMVIDDSNPAAAQMYGGMFAARKKQMEKDQTNQDISKHRLDRSNTQDQWRIS